jgi:hypothetical protein
VASLQFYLNHQRTDGKRHYIQQKSPGLLKDKNEGFYFFAASKVFVLTFGNNIINEAH